MSKVILEIKNIFRNLCGSLSEEEILKNQSLIKNIERIEKMLCSNQNESIQTQDWSKE